MAANGKASRYASECTEKFKPLVDEQVALLVWNSSNITKTATNDGEANFIMSTVAQLQFI